MIFKAAIASLAVFTAVPAFADIEVRFVEGAPKDRFVFTATENFCASGPVAITVNLEDSAGALIFDVTDSGAGVEVFQPFEVVSGAEFLLGTSAVSDGDVALTLELSALTPQSPVAFTIDVDDTLGGREITVAGSEILGGTVSVAIEGVVKEATFNERAVALIAWSACQS